MKTKNRILFSSIITLASLATNASADVTKINNNTALNLGGSYLGGVAPTGSDLLLIDSTNMSGATTPSLGDNVSILGISASSANNLTVGNTAGKTLTIGASGINSSGIGAFTFNNATSLGGNITMASTATGSITFGALTLAANQTWALGGTSNNNRINVQGTLTTGGNTLGISAANGNFGIINFSGSNTLGSGVTIGTIGNMYVQGGGVTVSLNGTNNTNTAFSIFNGGTANIASMGNLTGASSIGKGSALVSAGTTLNYTGGDFSSNKGFSGSGATTSRINVTTSGQTLSMSGAITATAAGAGGWTFGGAGNLTLSGVINNNSGTTVTKTDAGTLTLSNAANTYAGQTNVNGGKLTIESTGNINSTSAVSIGAGEFNYNASTALSKAVTFSSTGGTLSGNGTISQAVNVTTGNTLAIGNSVGQMNFGGNLAVGGTFLHELTGGSTTADLGDVTGALTLGGILDLVQLGTYTAGNKFTLFAYDGALSGTFTTPGLVNIADDTQFTDAGGIWELNYNDTSAGLNGGVSASNTYVTITAVPEPNAAALLGGLGVLCLLRRRRTQ